MVSIFAELKRRHIYRVAAAYAVVAWVLLQLVNNVAPVLDLPVWVARALLLVLVIGFPITLLIAWTHELNTPADGVAGHHVTGKLDWFLASGLVVVIALVSYQQLAPVSGTSMSQQPTTAVVPTPVETPAEASAIPAVTPVNSISIAVLPFVNLSGDPDQEFFSDGMTEEITSALARVKDLRVVGRTSAFAFKGKNEDLRTIGKALSANYLLEGSVRTSGSRVRITAQLIKTDEGMHLWTENYDRQLTDVFAIQDDIAQAIAAALQVPLGVKQGETLVANRTTDTDAYQDYLRAHALVRTRVSGGAKPLTEPVALLEQVVTRDPNYVPAWALLALTYTLVPNYDPAYYGGSVTELRRLADSSLVKAEIAARRAIQLDARNADGYTALGYFQALRGNYLGAEDLFKQALTLDPVNPETLHQYSVLIAATGRLKEAALMREQLSALEPLVPVYNSSTARVLWASGQTDAAIAVNNSLSLDYPNRWLILAMIYASLGRYGEAADAVMAIPSGVLITREASEAASRLLRAAPATTALPQTLPDLGLLAFVYNYAGAPERALEFLERVVETGYQATPGRLDLWHSSFATVRKTERFKALVRKAGLVEYWRARGWPEFCHPTSGDDFECE